MLREQTFDANGVTINYAEGLASAPPLVLLHGGGDRWQHCLPIIPALASVLADLPVSGPDPDAPVRFCCPAAVPNMKNMRSKKSN